MAVYSIRPLRLGTIVRKKSNMVYACGDDRPTDFPLVAYYLEGGGHKILVDTGGSAPDGVHWMPYERPADESLDAALRKIGVSPAEIDTVLFTHLHWDHAGNNALLPNARFLVQRLEYEFVASEGEKPGFERELVLRSRYELLDGDCAVLDGISVLLAPGHSVGSQCVLVDTDEGKKLLTGDLIPTFENWRAEPKLPNGGYYDLDVIRTSVEKIGALGCDILPGHDALVFEMGGK